MKAAVVITGASRGFGRCLALAFASEVADDCDVDMFLWSRNDAAINETEQLVREQWGSKAATLRVTCQVVDLSSREEYVPKVDALMEQLQTVAYDSLYLVHNAGSLGMVANAHELPSAEMLAKYMELNVNSVMWFNAKFLSVYGRFPTVKRAAEAPATSSTIVNISSLLALEPYETHGLYCVGKAAREMHHRVIADEHNGDDDADTSATVRVLNYAPGAMDTLMQKELRESETIHPKYGAMFRKLKEDGTLVKPDESAQIGVRVVLDGEYESGAHVDYHDVAIE